MKRADSTNKVEKKSLPGLLQDKVTKFGLPGLLHEQVTKFGGELFNEPDSKRVKQRSGTIFF